MREAELLREIVAEPAPPTTDAYVRARAALLDRIAAAGRPRRTLRRRWLLPAAGLAAAGAAAAAVLLTIGPSAGTASAASVLRSAAAAARVQEAPPVLAPGQYLYTRSENAYLLYTRSENAYLTTAVNGDGKDFSALVAATREVWLERGGTGWLHERSARPVFLGERDRERWVAAGRPHLGGSLTDMALDSGDGQEAPMYSLDLPSDPDALWDRLQADAQGKGHGLHEEMFVLVGDALRETFTTPAQRAALYEVAARIPGVELVGGITDHTGRPGIAVAMRDRQAGVRFTLIFDPGTGTLLGEEQVALAGNWWGYPEGTVVGWATYLETAVVDAIRTRPDGSAVGRQRDRID